MSILNKIYVLGITLHKHLQKNPNKISPNQALLSFVLHNEK